MDDHRRSKRHHLILYLDVIERNTHELLGHLGDISETGMMFITQKTFAINEIKDVKIQLPDSEQFQGKCIEARIKVVWRKPNINPDLSCIGCCFIELASEDAPLIHLIGEELGFQTDIHVNRVS